ncbi:hypothetical protein I302_108130 [Kwoniella bestiolae CBS 10118]|uniref:Uncharacterized protein n=1 Tax=Kwoniella bestiolae CBS 10118 TaxID=1296100 RepID=A0A1B9FWL7_9TREE|nr:hypothetical protein I302_07504 [Kwoniella bestiolae CBS 10118]OCF23151.1 hypothetical protein I302_07504 [Kwoniella bestiolae CBS 10118]
MKKSLGPMTLIDTNPPRFTHNNLPSSSHVDVDTQKPKGRFWTSEDDTGNQATYLFFPIFASFLLILLSSLSTPIIEGLGIAKIGVEGGGKVIVGTWGWCISGFEGVENQCSADKGFNVNLSSTLKTLPEPLNGIQGISDQLKVDYLVGSGVMHILACLSVWMTLCWTLASSGSWKSKERHAHDWTKWAFNGAGFSAILILIAWALDLGMFTRLQSASSGITIDDESLSVKPGAAIFMNLFSFLLCLGSYITRLTWDKFRPRPSWTVKGNSDFHHPPNSAALPPSEDAPPTWEPLNISPNQLTIDEKPPIIQIQGSTPTAEADPNSNSVDQRGFMV